MNNWTEPVVLILTAAGYFLAGISWENRKVSRWRIEWIKMEHILADYENRPARDIADADKDRFDPDTWTHKPD